MGLTLNGHYLYGLNITDGASLNPVSIGSAGVVSYTIGSALFLGGTVDWTLGNSGTVQSTGTGSSSLGILLSGGTNTLGGTITNYAGGLISGAAAGVFDAAAATVINQGSIAGTDATIGAALVLGGGAVVNGVGGTLQGGQNGVSFTASGVVVNSGAIAGGTGVGVTLAAGAVTNVTASAITGYTAGIRIAGAGLVANSGTITGSATVGKGYAFSTVTHLITLASGGVLVGSGQVTNAAGGTISAPFIGVGIAGGGTLDNAGTILSTATTSSLAVLVQGGGSIVNRAGGVIQGNGYGVFGYGTAAPLAVVNAGTIRGQGVAGVRLRSPGMIENQAGGTISSSYAGAWQTRGGLVSNGGSIAGDAYGVVVQGDNGTVANAAGGQITSASFGVWFPVAPSGSPNSPGIVTNAGTIASSRTFGGAAVKLGQGGDVTNTAQGHINGQWIGVQFGDSTVSAGGTLTNQGSIFASDGTNGAAVWMHGPGVILNEAGASISGGPYAIVTYYQTTLINRGTVLGQSTISSNYFAFDAAVNAGVHNLIVASPGAVFTGKVAADVGTSATGTLELAAGTIAGAIAGFGSKYTGFSNVIVDSGARWSLAGTISATQTITLPGTGTGLTLASPAAVAGTIFGFDASETLTLGGITDVTAATLGAGNLLTISESGGGTITLQFDPAQQFTGTSFGFSVAGGSTNLVVPCFAAGTRLQAAHGEVAVEQLRPGMLLHSAFGGTAPVQWIGHRRIDCAHHPRPHDVWPIRVRAGAFAPGVPHTDVLLSPDHALYLDGHLIPVRYLVNARTIVQERVASIAYYHVELPAHDVVLAEGLPAETYLDTGNRGAFANAPGAVQLHADFARAAWAEAGCAPLVLDGPVVTAARQALLERAEGLGHARTRLPALRVMAGGRVLPARIDGRRWRVALPPAIERLRLLSRRWCPDETDPAGGDARQLGVALAGIALDGVALARDDARLGAGWHAAEPAWRWTDGDAAILAGGARLLHFELALTGLYWQDPLSAAPPGSAPAAAPRPPRGAAG